MHATLQNVHLYIQPYVYVHLYLMCVSMHSWPSSELLDVKQGFLNTGLICDKINTKHSGVQLHVHWMYYSLVVFPFFMGPLPFRLLRGQVLGWGGACGLEEGVAVFPAVPACTVAPEAQKSTAL